jgi:hypothetical protein
VIFLRICEDRGIEEPDALKTAAARNAVYARLLALFEAADEKYNSGLFHADALSKTVVIDDKVLKGIIKSLYYPAPYAFAVFPADILGSVYERFLGKVIRVTAGHRAKVEEKPEVRKAGGVYYTPEYITRYIVERTLGAALEGKTPESAAGLRVLDPACGSGSFLIEAYQYLLDWHRAAYQAARAKYGKRLVGAGGEERLSIQERKRILTAHIFGSSHIIGKTKQI